MCSVRRFAPEKSAPSGLSFLLVALVCTAGATDVGVGMESSAEGFENVLNLEDGWFLKSSALVKADPATVATAGYAAQDWYAISVPCTVLNALVKHQVYPDPRFATNDMLIPDASDEFNAGHDLLKYSYLPDQRNPWADPYWYRTEFALPESTRGRRIWLTFKGINYRADVWVNGRQIADGRQVAGSYSRYRFDITEHARPGERNCLAVQVHLVDHPGMPDTQFEVYGKDREFRKENLRDVTFTQWKLNDCWPGVQWQIYDWFGKPMVSYYYIKSACAPLHVQLTPLDATITVINNRPEPQDGLEVRARVFDLAMKLKWEKRERIAVGADTYQDTFAVPLVPDLTPVYFVRLDLADAKGKLVSSNFYWQAARGDDLTPLNAMPLARLNVSHRFETRGDETSVRVRLENPTDRLAFFVHVAVTDGTYGEEVLPVFWDDNYFSLLPQEIREISAKIPAHKLGESPMVEVGGWNVESAYACAGVDVSKPEVGPNEEVVVTAHIANTFIDGSRVSLLVDDQPLASRLVWARAGKMDQAVFKIRLEAPGQHVLQVGGREALVVVR